MSTEQTFQATPAWQRLFSELDQLDEHGLAALWGMSKYWRANLPGEVAVLVGVLDCVRDLATGLVADRKGMTFEQIEAIYADALTKGGEGNG